MTVLRLDRLNPTQRAAVERAIRPRQDIMLSRRFARVDVEKWQKAAKRARLTLTAWMRQTLNANA